MTDNKKMALTRIVVLVLMFANSILAHYGYNPIPVSHDFIYQTISDIILIGTIAWPVYKNNDFTKEAEQGTAVTRKLKNQKLSRDEHKAFVEAKDKFTNDGPEI